MTGTQEPSRVPTTRRRTPGARCATATGPACACVPFSAGAGRRRVWGNALFSVGGLSVNLLGGDAPHIGAVAVALPRASLVRRGRRSATTSVLAIVGHKDDAVARSMADALARHLGVTVVVTAGIHIARARPADIAAVLRNARAATKAILATAASARAAERSGA